MISTFRTKNFDLTENAKMIINSKLEKISNIFNDDTIFNLYVLKRDKDYKCEIKVQNGRDFVRSEETGKTLERAIDNTILTLKKRTRKIKSMRITKKRGNDAIKMKESKNDLDETIESMDDVELKDYKIERRKYFEVDSKTEEEAILGIESLNHSFYIFKNKDLNDKICIVYRRNVGYGLIETDLWLGMRKMNKKLVCGLSGIALLVVAAGIVTAVVVKNRD